MISKTFKTPIGLIFLNLFSNYTDIKLTSSGNYENGNFNRYISLSHRVEIIESTIRSTTYYGEKIIDSKCWLVRIEKIKNHKEFININVGINNVTNDVKFGIEAGEHLDAFEASNDKWKLHVGTEDGEMLNRRAETNNWFPTRLTNRQNYYQEITKLYKSSIKTDVPHLEVGEKLSLQYLIAVDKQCDNVYTWLAVDDFKDDLEKWIGIK